MIYSKIENKYIDGLSLTTSPEYSSFKPLFNDRNYELYSVFGSRRSDFPELGNGTYGIPDFLPKTYKEYLHKMDYYGYVYWNILDFKQELNQYVKKMKNPKRFYENDDWVQDQIANNTFDLKRYDMDVNYVYRQLKEFIKTIDDILQFPKYCDIYDDIIDINKTVFLFYFDN